MAAPRARRRHPAPSFRFRAVTLGPLSHVLPDLECAARARARRTQLFRTHAGAERRAGGGGRRPRPARLVADGLRQDRRLWPRHRRDPARRGGGFRPGRTAARPDHRADARTGAAGAARARLALQARQCPHHRLRRRHGPPRREAALLDEAPMSSSARRAACATISSAIASTSRRSRPSCSTRPDEMLDLGFRDDLEFILKTAPAERRSLLFSATLPKAIIHLAKSYQNDALRIEVAGDARGHADIEYRAIRATRRKPSSRSSTCCASTIRPARWCSATPATRCAISRRSCWSAASRPWRSRANSRRASAIRRCSALRDGRARVCVATDVAARGIDLPGLTLVIHAELPNDPEVMQHRSGPHRPRRQEGHERAAGAAVAPPQGEMLLAEAKVEAVWAGPPTQEKIRCARPRAAAERPDPDRRARRGSMAAMVEALLAGRSANEIAAALVRIYRTRPAGGGGGRRPELCARRAPSRPAREDYAPREGARFGEHREGSRARRSPQSRSAW